MTRAVGSPVRAKDGTAVSRFIDGRQALDCCSASQPVETFGAHPAPDVLYSLDRLQSVSYGMWAWSRRSVVRTAVQAAILLGGATLAAKAEAADIVGAALVRNDASLSIHGRAVRLVGIYVPSTSTFCRTFQSPVQCGSRAALALDFHIGSRLVHCNALGRYSDGSIAATCWIAGRYLNQRRDLAAWLIAEGWALASPEAPFEYVALERIAREQGRGVWGFIVDRID